MGGARSKFTQAHREGTSAVPQHGVGRRPQGTAAQAAGSERGGAPSGSAERRPTQVYTLLASAMALDVAAAMAASEALGR